MAAQDEVRREAGAMKDEARAMWNDAAGVARSAAAQQQQAAAQGLGSFAGALREAARNTEGGAAPSSRVAESIADGLDRFSSSLKGRDLNSLVRDVEDFARSQPLVFFGAAVATGFIAMRFLKSSAPGDAPPDGTGASMPPAMSEHSMARRESDTAAPGAWSGVRSTDTMRNTDVPNSAASADAGTSTGNTSGLRSDTARGGGSPQNVWPEADPVEKDTRPPGTPSRPDR